MRVDQIINADCLVRLKTMDDDCIDLIVTSPPYAGKRGKEKIGPGRNPKKRYTTIQIEDYVEWFLPISAELLRVLKPTGSFVLNIKEPASNGERSTFVIELILEMRKQGWFWVEEYIWNKRNSFPGKWPNRFRDSLLVCALIESRSSERFLALHQYLPKDLQKFYSKLHEAEVRHSNLYINLYRNFFGDQLAKDIQPFSEIEASLITQPDPLFRFHSGI